MGIHEPPMTTFQLLDFKVVSVNRRLMPHRKKSGKVGLLTTPEYQKCKEDLILVFRSQKPNDWKPLSENIAVYISIKTNSDIDNCIKLILDAMEGAEVITVDRQIDEIAVRRIKERLGPENILIITITQTQGV